MQVIRYKRRCGKSLMYSCIDFLSFFKKVFVLSALIELIDNKNAAVALKIFELGMRRFAAASGFVMAYLDFLYYTGNYPSMRAVIEVALQSLPPTNAGAVWEKFTMCEASHGTLSSVGGEIGGAPLDGG